MRWDRRRAPHSCAARGFGRARPGRAVGGSGAWRSRQPRQVWFGQQGAGIARRPGTAGPGSQAQRGGRQQLLGQVGAGLPLRLGGFGERQGIAGRVACHGSAIRVGGIGGAGRSGGYGRGFGGGHHRVRECSRPARQGQEGQHHDQQEQPQGAHEQGTAYSVEVEGILQDAAGGGRRRGGGSTPTVAAASPPPAGCGRLAYTIVNPVVVTGYGKEQAYAYRRTVTIQRLRCRDHPLLRARRAARRAPARGQRLSPL
ncbi:protein of unknown function [Cupriavidus neocaledonicus]|uniref:Uncharacterized protein n=1 Tax=Cupriavidus neocaledonicus TaxID=1040979 RepID=A0A375HDM0_9BURK|nr:protein of unknown function [Cupriavidus neocaledonicus]